MNHRQAPCQISHIGIAVRSLDEAIPLYRDILGLAWEGTETVESEQVRVAFFRIGETRIELLEPLSPESAIAKHLEKRGAGIHHIALEVNDIKRCLSELADQGIQLIHERPKQGAHNAKVAFLHPKSTGGVLFELCEHGTDSE
jgi:methylmalonyl-CoA epimerase